MGLQGVEQEERALARPEAAGSSRPAVPAAGSMLSKWFADVDSVVDRNDLSLAAVKEEQKLELKSQSTDNAPKSLAQKASVDEAGVDAIMGAVTPQRDAK